MAQTFELGQVPERFQKAGFEFSTSSGSKFKLKDTGGRLQPVKVKAQEVAKTDIQRRIAENKSGASSAGTGDPTDAQKAEIARRTTENKATKTIPPPDTTGGTTNNTTGSSSSGGGGGGGGGSSDGGNNAFTAAVAEEARMREEDAKKQEQLAKRGLSMGENGTGLDLSQFGQQGQLLNQQALLAQEVAGGQAQAAMSVFDAKEQARKTNLISSLGTTNIGQTLSASGVDLKGLSNTELEGLLKNPNLELSQRVQERMSAEGESALESIAIQRTQLMANNEYQQNQLERDFDRSISEREKFNAQQDSKLRRLAASFGGGKIESMGNNVAIMKEAENGQKVIDSIRGDFIDKKTLLSSQANTVIDTYHNNKRLIEGEMAGLLEDKLAEITSGVDAMMNQGITNVAELQTNIAAAKKDYMTLYSKVTDKAIDLMTKENDRLFETQKILQQQNFQIEQDRTKMAFTKSERIAGEPTSWFGDTPSQYSSTPTRNTNVPNLNRVSQGNEYTRDDGTQGLLGENCVKYARSKVPALPWGLFTKQDKQKAIEKFGNSDMSQVKVGDVILTAEGTDGHAAIVKSIDWNTGRLTLDEANYESGWITDDGTISYDDTNIYGFIESGEAVFRSVGGNVELEGTNKGIQEQVDESVAPAVGSLDFEALEFAEGRTTVASLKASGFTPEAFNAVRLRASEMKQSGEFLDQELDPKSNSILAQTGLDLGSFMALTGQMSKLSRDAATRNAALKGAEKFANENGVDVSTFTSQYDSINKVLGSNIERMNMTKIMEDELIGTIENLQVVVNDADLGDLKVKNVLKIWGGQQVNDPLAQQYSLHLFQLREELAAYAAALQGRGGSQISDSDIRHAELVIQNGVSTGSLRGLSDAIESSTEKMGAVLQRSVTSAENQVWDLFGLEKPQAGQTGNITVKDPQGNTGTIPANQLQEALKAGYTQIN